MSLKKLIAVLAVSGPLVASAQQAAAPAPAPLYQIYGTLNVNGQYVEISKPFNRAGTNVAGRFGVSTDSTNVGIKGVADLGQYGLGVVYQCESSAAVDGDGVAGICGRNSRLGLSTAFGTVFYGNWDTPYKSAWYGTKADDAFGNTDIYDAAGLMSSPGFKTKASAGLTASGPATSGTVAAGATPPVTGYAGFAVRAANSIAYHSPKVAGAQVKGQWSTNERATNNGKLTGQLWSIGANYDQGPLSVLAAYERHEDWSGFNVFGETVSDNAFAPARLRTGAKGTRDSAVKAGAGYELGSPFGATTIGAVWELLTYGYANKDGLLDGDLTEASRQAVMINVKHRMGNHEFRARYEYADGGKCKILGGTCSTVGAGAQNYALGYAYYLSKAAQVYAYWTKIENERFATYTFSTAGPAALTTSWSAGADPMGAGLGMRYAF